MQLGSLDEANFKAAKSLTAWEKLEQTDRIAKDSTRILLFSWEILMKKTRLFLIKVSQWCVFNRLMDAATQSLGCYQISPNLVLKTQYWD